jgi:5'-nucleotidase
MKIQETTLKSVLLYQISRFTSFCISEPIFYINMRPTILITNDDGLTAKGIKVLKECMLPLGDVVVVGPDGPRSGMSSAITVSLPTRLHKVHEEDGLKIYRCSGTPVDCVKLALNVLFKDKHPDLLVTGINHGTNSSISVVYSGTMGAAIEGCINKVPSIGFSLCNHQPDADFEHITQYVSAITQKVLENGLPQGVCLNVNMPEGTPKGVKVCRQASGLWTEEFVRQLDPNGHPYFWLTGNFTNREPEAIDTDEWALANNYIAVVPTKIDMTAYDALEELKTWAF